MNIGLVDIFDPVPKELNDAEYVRIGYLAKYLLNRGHKVTWWTSDYSHFEKRFRGNPFRMMKTKEFEIINVKGVPYQKHVSMNRMAHHLFCAKSVYKEIRNTIKNRRFDIVHMSNIPLEVSGSIGKLFSDEAIPFNLDFRDNWPDSFCSKATWFMRPFVKELANYWVSRLQPRYWSAESFTAVSETYLNWALHRFQPNPNCRRAVFPLAQGSWVQDYERHQEERRKEYRKKIGASENTVVFTFIGTVGKSYQPDIMRDLQSSAKEQGYNAVVVIVGDGDCMEKVKAAFPENSGTVFTGWVAKEQAHGYLAASDICVMSYSENATQSLPNKIFDYMAAGRPQISSLAGEAEFLLKKYGVGLTYRAGSKDDFLKCAHLYGKDVNMRREHGNSASKVFKQNYTAEHVYEKFAIFLEEGSKRDDFKQYLTKH